MVRNPSATSILSRLSGLAIFALEEAWAVDWPGSRDNGEKRLETTIKGTPGLRPGFVPAVQVGPNGYHRKEITWKAFPASFDERIDRLNLLMRGWLHYFKPGSMFGKLNTMDGWVRNRLRYCIWHHWKKPRRRAISLIRLGVPQHMAWQWAMRRLGGWAVSCSPILTTTITLDRLKSKGYKSFLPPCTRPVRTVV